MLTAPRDDRSSVVSRMIPEGYLGEKETQTSKPLPKVKNKRHCHPKEDVQGGQKDKTDQMFENNALQEPPLNKSTESFAALCFEHFTNIKLCERPQPVGRIIPRQLSCTACHRNT